MRVFHVITGLNAGGAERMLSRVCKALHDDSEIEQSVICLIEEGMYGPILRQLGVEVICLNMRRRSLSLAGFRKFVSILRRLKPDVVMSWMYHADLITTLALPLAGLSYRRLIWNVRCSDIYFRHVPRTTRLTVRALALLASLPRAIVVNSRKGRESHTGYGYQPHQWEFIPNGFDLQEWRPDEVDRLEVRRQLGFDDRHIVFCHVARLDPQKDHANFFAAASALLKHEPLAKFLFIGSGTQELDLPKELEEASLKLGERPDVARVIRAADIMVLSSLSEGFPNTLGEGMATAIPCVATDVGECKELIGDTGLVVPPRDSAALANAMETMASKSPQERQVLGQLARQRISENFSIGMIADRYRKLIVGAAADDRLRSSAKARAFQ